MTDNFTEFTAVQAARRTATVVYADPEEIARSFGVYIASLGRNWPDFISMATYEAMRAERAAME